MTLPTPVEAERLLRPEPELERDVLAFLEGQLGRVLPRRERSGVHAYYRWVALGPRSLEGLRTLLGHRGDSSLPILDIGSGLGTTVLLANTSGIPAQGVEPGEEELALAVRRAEAAGVDPDVFRSGVGEELPYEDGSFSGALLHDVLEHVGDWRRVLAEARRVLAPGGVLYVKGPSYTVRFFEPHYKLPWLPLLPKPVARRYLALLGRDVGYFEHIGYRRRGAVLAELRRLGFELSFPRLEKLRDPDAINREWVRRLVARARRPDGSLPPIAERLAESPLQSAIDVLACVPRG